MGPLPSQREVRVQAAWLQGAGLPRQYHQGGTEPQLLVHTNAEGRVHTNAEGRDSTIAISSVVLDIYVPPKHPSRTCFCSCSGFLAEAFPGKNKTTNPTAPFGKRVDSFGVSRTAFFLSKLDARASAEQALRMPRAPFSCTPLLFVKRTVPCIPHQ